MSQAGAPPGLSAGRRAGRELAIAVLLGAVACAVLLWVLGRPWLDTVVVTDGMPRQEVTATGAEALPWLRASSLAALAALGAGLVGAGRLRRALGLLTTGLALAVAAGCAWPAGAAEQTLRVRARLTAAGADPGAVDAALADADAGPWRWLGLAAAVLLAGVGAAVAVLGARWPAMGRRFEPDRPRDPGPQDDPPPDSEDSRDLWRAIDDGHDPTT